MSKKTPVLFAKAHDPELSRLLQAIFADSLGKLENSSLAEMKSDECFHALSQLLGAIGCDQSIKKGLSEFKVDGAPKIEQSIELSLAEQKLLIFTAFTQNAMRRPVNSERHDLPDPDLFKEKRPVFLNLFDKLGMKQAIIPSPKKVHALILCGGFGFRFIDRLTLVALPLLKKYNPDRLYIATTTSRLLQQDWRDLGAIRKLLPDDEFSSLQAEIKELKNERQISEFLVTHVGKINKEAGATLKNEKLEIIYTDASPKPGDFRARSDDTVQGVKDKEAKKTPEKESVMILCSDNPFLEYQMQTFLCKLGIQGRELLCAGSAAKDESPICDFYDALTRTMFATSVRLLCKNHNLEYAAAAKIVSVYTAAFQCSSLITTYQETYKNVAVVKL